MADLLETRVKTIKKKMEEIKAEIEKLNQAENEGRLAPLERMKLDSLREEQKEFQAKLRELLL